MHFGLGRSKEVEKLNWSAVVKDLAATAAESLASATHGTTIMDALVSAGTKGLSFSALKDHVKLTPGSLTHELETLQRGGLIENFLERRDESKDYSYYRATRTGTIVLSEYEIFFDDLQRHLILSSKSPEIRKSVESEELLPVRYFRLHFDTYRKASLVKGMFEPYSIQVLGQRSSAIKHPTTYPDLVHSLPWLESEEQRLAMLNR